MFYGTGYFKKGRPLFPFTWFFHRPNHMILLNLDPKAKIEKAEVKYEGDLLPEKFSIVGLQMERATWQGIGAVLGAESDSHW